MVNFIAPTPRMKPSAAVNIGHSDFYQDVTSSFRNWVGVMPKRILNLLKKLGTSSKPLSRQISETECVEQISIFFA